MRSKVIFIVGPTAIGKTKTAINLAKKIDGEIISCDSMQIYKGIPVLSCAPTPKNFKAIPHHLIAELSPKKEYSAAQFSKKATSLIKKIIKRKKTPIIVGGTGLYVKALIDGLFPSPKKDPVLRKKLELKAEKCTSLMLYTELKKIDPIASQNIHPNDTRRIIRALEIYYLTGIPMSIHKKNTKGIANTYDIQQTGLLMPREDLYEKINRRVDKMFKDGLLDEVKRLLELRLSMTAVLAIGIKEIRGYLNGEYTLKEAKELIKKHTRNYAKKQLTWFRRDKRIEWFSDGKSLISYCRFGK
ncbi:MAG: tRNA (adenosine(37)-N6)-dimethylallyltransferase MiaA [Candidatus Omnitrophica bacterium]|nr:tRNA (adenosine(37)-N6)-dimethylallyltransferase MiaA [Candidatus Omnitrophota bacterium]